MLVNNAKLSKQNCVSFDDDEAIKKMDADFARLPQIIENNEFLRKTLSDVYESNLSFPECYVLKVLLSSSADPRNFSKISDELEKAGFVSMSGFLEVLSYAPQYDGDYGRPVWQKSDIR